MEYNSLHILHLHALRHITLMTYSPYSASIHHIEYIPQVLPSYPSRHITIMAYPPHGASLHHMKYVPHVLPSYTPRHITIMAYPPYGTSLYHMEYIPHVLPSYPLQPIINIAYPPYDASLPHIEYTPRVLPFPHVTLHHHYSIPAVQCVTPLHGVHSTCTHPVPQYARRVYFTYTLLISHYTTHRLHSACTIPTPHTSGEYILHILYLSLTMPHTKYT